MEKVKFSLGDTQEYQDWVQRMMQAMPSSEASPMPEPPMPSGPMLMYQGQPARVVDRDAAGNDVLMMMGGPRKGQRMTR